MNARAPTHTPRTRARTRAPLPLFGSAVHSCAASSGGTVWKLEGQGEGRHQEHHLHRLQLQWLLRKNIPSAGGCGGVAGNCRNRSNCCNGSCAAERAIDAVSSVVYSRVCKLTPCWLSAARRHIASCTAWSTTRRTLTRSADAAQHAVPHGIPCRTGYRAARDTVPCGIPYRTGYHAARDTVPCGIPCRAGYHAAWDTIRLCPLSRSVRTRLRGGRMRARRSVE